MQTNEKEKEEEGRGRKKRVTLDEIVSRLESIENKIVVHEDRLVAVEDISHTNSEDITSVKKNIEDVEAQIDKLRSAKYTELCYVLSISMVVLLFVLFLFTLFGI